MNEVDGRDHPFIRYGSHLDVRRRAAALGLDDDDWARLVLEADARVRRVDGRGFVITPLIDIELGSRSRSADRTALGPVVAKVETGAVGGSHKARHLFGLLLGLELDRRDGSATDQRLVIASCGNAALGAAIVARSAQRPLEVFVPVDADPDILAALKALEAEITVCHRTPGTEGDPCMAALGHAQRRGDRPFTVQGTIVAEAVDGARTIGLELADQLTARALRPGRILVQVGGGALATAVMDGLARGQGDAPLPPLHPVQPETAHPYVAAWRRTVQAVAEQRGESPPEDNPSRARWLARARNDGTLARVLADGQDLMVAWPEPPKSVASGIVDDTTYDWRTVLDHQVTSGGWPVTVPEQTFTDAVGLLRHQVDPAPDATGAAGVAGLIELASAGEAEPVEDGAVNIVLATGAATKRRS